MEKEEVAEKWKKSRWGVKTEEAMQVLYGCTDGVDLNKVVPETDVLHGLYNGDGEAFSSDLAVLFEGSGVAVKHHKRWNFEQDEVFGVTYPWRGEEAKVLAENMLFDALLINADTENCEIEAGCFEKSGTMHILRVFSVPDGKLIKIQGIGYSLHEIRHITLQGDLLVYKTDRDDDVTGWWLHELLGCEKKNTEFCNAANRHFTD